MADKHNAVPKSVLLKQVIDFAASQKMTKSQKNRLIELASSELATIGDFEMGIEAKINLLLGGEVVQDKTGAAKPERQLKHYAETTDNPIKNIHPIRYPTKIKHNPIQTFKILNSFKFTESEFPSFKNLLHGSEISPIELFEKQIKEASKEFYKLNNVPYLLYKKLEDLIRLYNDIGIEKAKKEQRHPFDSDKNLPQELDKSKYRFILRIKEDKFYSKFNTAIQGFKKEYRFESNDLTEASNLEELIKNKFYFEKFNSPENVFSFGESDSTKKYHTKQIKFDLKESAFFAWNPSLKGMLHWIISGILKHSNIKGNKEFTPSEKEITVRSFQYSDPNNGNDYVILEITDILSYIDKKPHVFGEYVYDEAQQYLTSVCDFEVCFFDEEGMPWKSFILPKGKTELTQEKIEGLTYRFLFLKDIL